MRAHDALAEPDLADDRNTDVEEGSTDNTDEDTAEEKVCASVLIRGRLGAGNVPDGSNNDKRPLEGGLQIVVGWVEERAGTEEDVCVGAKEHLESEDEPRRMVKEKEGGRDDEKAGNDVDQLKPVERGPHVDVQKAVCPESVEGREKVGPGRKEDHPKGQRNPHRVEDSCGTGVGEEVPPRRVVTKSAHVTLEPPRAIRKLGACHVGERVLGKRDKDNGSPEGDEPFGHVPHTRIGSQSAGAPRDNEHEDHHGQREYERDDQQQPGRDDARDPDKVEAKVGQGHAVEDLPGRRAPVEGPVGEDAQNLCEKEPDTQRVREPREPDQTAPLELGSLAHAILLGRRESCRPGSEAHADRDADGDEAYEHKGCDCEVLRRPSTRFAGSLLRREPPRRAGGASVPDVARRAV